MTKVDISKLPAEKRAAIEARRAYQREWRAKNRDKTRAYEERYWARKAAGMNVISPENAENKA